LTVKVELTSAQFLLQHRFELIRSLWMSFKRLTSRTTG